MYRVKRREWSLVIALILINYVVFNTFFNLAYQSRQPKPTPSRTPHPTFTPNWDATATRVAELPPTDTPAPATPTPPPTSVPSDTVAPVVTASAFAPTATATRRMATVKATPSAASSKTITHTLQSGETLYQVAVQYRINVADLLEANDLESPNHVNTGMVLTVPLATRQQATATRSPTRRARPTATAAVKTHTVQSGETLSLIAKEYDVTTAAIIEASDLENPNVLSVGQVLTIPVSKE